MQIEVGKNYRTRSGQKVSIFGKVPDEFCFTHNFTGVIFGMDGVDTWHYLGGFGLLPEKDHRNDLVCEWVEPELDKPGAPNTQEFLYTPLQGPQCYKLFTQHEYSLMSQPNEQHWRKIPCFPVED